MITIDEQAGTVTVEQDGTRQTLPLASPEAFHHVSQAWLRAGWDNKYVYSFSWLGRPIIQLPDDMIRLQEVIYQIQPDLIIETGVAHGGSLIFYAGLCKLMGKGRVIGIDIEIRPHNRKAIEEHALFEYITLIEGSSVDTDTLHQVKKEVQPNDKVLVLLDSCHSKAHVLQELELYSPLVSKDSYIIAMDGIMQQVAGAPRTDTDWTWNNPLSAIDEFLAANVDFVRDEPLPPFNEGNITSRVTYTPSGFLKKIS